MDCYKRFCSGLALAAIVVLIAGPALAGSVTGTVKFEGTPPTLKPTNMATDPSCAKKHASPPKNEMLVLGSGNTMGNVLVRVRSGATGSYSAPKEAVALDQNGCQYAPHVLAMMADQPLKIKNSDGLLHNVHALPKVNQGFNQAMPGSVKEVTRTFSKTEPPFKIKCDVHPWMAAYIAVLDNPYYDVTSADGKFTLDDLPPGDYEIEAWHEKLKTKSAKVSIKGDEAATVDFSFSAPQR
jgi:plastocyanin